MNTLINRFFTKNESENAQEDVLIDGRHNALQFVLDKASKSKNSLRLQDRLDAFRFAEEPFIANLEFASLYLDIEFYLIHTDPRFIGSDYELRKELIDHFPESIDLQLFSILLNNKEVQETWLCKLFLQYALYSLTKNERCGQYALNRFEGFDSRFPYKNPINIVERVNITRRLREYGNNIYFELTPLLGKEETDQYFHQAYNAFRKIFIRLETTASIGEVIPLLEDKPKEVPVRKLVPVKDKDSNQNGMPKEDHRSILENMIDGFVLIDNFGRIQDFNRNALEIFGLEKDALKDTYIFDLLPIEIAENLKADLQRTDFSVPRKVIGKRTEILLEGPGNVSLDYEVSITNNYQSNKTTYSIFLRNISSKTHMLEAIREAKINAERSAKAKSTFLSNMSHEIRTPLNVIIGLSEMIKNGDFEDESMLRKKIDGIDFSAKNLLSIVNDILDFSKIEAGKLTIQSIDFNLRKVVENLAEGFEIKAKEKGLFLEAHMDEKIPDVVIGDQYRLNQILTNLIGNAIKFTKTGKITINVNLETLDENDMHLMFSVEDTGIGIPEEHLSRIFDSFYQVDSRENPEVNGTGLGLAITRELIKLQNGKFTASSVVDEGSVFEFTLPFKLSKLKNLNSSRDKVVREDKKLAGLKVLVAEDNKMNQFYIKHLLGRLNVDVDIAENGKEAVSIFGNDKNEYDLILMDMHMPIMNGIEAITEIRKSNKDSIKKVPIVACSADVFPESRKSAIKAGIDFYLTKPVSEEAIKEVLFWLISDEEFQAQPVKKESKTLEINEEISCERFVDISMLKENFDNDEEFIISLLDVFIKTTPEDYNSMRNCIEREYYARASAVAHKMKSSFMNLGMTLHGHHLQQIETNIIKKDGVPEALRHFKAFGKVYTKALLEVNLLLIELRGK